MKLAPFSHQWGQCMVQGGWEVTLHQPLRYHNLIWITWLHVHIITCGGLCSSSCVKLGFSFDQNTTFLSWPVFYTSKSECSFFPIQQCRCSWWSLIKPFPECSHHLGHGLSRVLSLVHNTLATKRSSIE
jgi:hypothetical protein